MQITRITSDIFAQYNLNPTSARSKILSICIEADTPQTVEAVANKVGNKAHLAAIYRTLERFVDVGILEKIDFQEGKFRYEYVKSHHHHAVCTECGKVEDIEDSQTEINSIENRVAKESGFLVTRHVMELFGLCNKCRQKGHS